MSRLNLVFLAISIIAWPVSAQESSDCPQPTGSQPPTLHYEYEQNEDIAEKVSVMVTEYLNTTGSTENLAEAITALSESGIPIDTQVFEADITGDGSENVLVSVNFSWGGGYTNIITVVGCRNNEFVTISSLVQGDFLAQTPPTTVVAVVDMNHNQRPEIVQRVSYASQKAEESVTIFEWQDDWLVEVFSTGYSLGIFDSVEVKDIDGDADTLELVVGDRWGYGQATATAVIEISRSRPIQVSYGWDGQRYTLICQFFTDQPTTRFETLHSAETHRACGDYEAAMVFYRDLLDNATLEGWTVNFGVQLPADVEDEAAYISDVEKAYLRAFAYFRIIQLQLLANDVEEAENMLELALDEYTIGTHGYQYVAMADVMVSVYRETNDLEAACEAATSEYDQVRENGDDPGLVYEVFESEYRDDFTYQFPFYWDSGKAYSSNPDEMFSVPADIADMIDMPICIQ